MIIKTKNNSKKPLFESQEVIQPVSQQLHQQIKLTPEQQKYQSDRQKIQEVFAVKANQFPLDSGGFMGKIHVKNDDSKFCLRYHALHSADVDSFIQSVADYITTTGKKLTDGDITRLKAEYAKFQK